MRWRSVLTGVSLMALATGAMPRAQASDEPLVPDRPGLYCGSLTVTEGFFQIESGFAYQRSEAAGVTDQSITTPIVVRVGLAESLEFRVVTPGFSWAKESVAAGSVSERGFGSATLGVKWRFAEAAERGPGPSMAFLFNLGLPVGSEFARPDRVEPSFLWAADFGLPSDVGLSANVGVSARFDPARRERFAEVFLAAAVGRAISPATALFVEIAATGAPDRDSQVVVDGGLTHLLNDDVQLDFSVTRGLSQDAADWALGGGISVRFR